MTTFHAAFAEFDEDYSKALEQLELVNSHDEGLSTLQQTEVISENIGLDDYTPPWLEPYVEITTQVLELRLVASGIETAELILRLMPIVNHAAQLGYMEGYYKGKTD